MADLQALTNRLQSLREILSESREFAPAIKNQMVVLVNDTIAALSQAADVAGEREANAVRTVRGAIAQGGRN